MAVCLVCDEKQATWPENQPPCGHRFCAECATHYLTGRITERRLPLQCCACEMEVDRVAAYQLITELSLRAKLEDFEMQRFLQLSPESRFCPRPNCSYAMLCPASTASCARVRCGGCSQDFCYICRDVWHEGPCPALAVVADSQLIKPCPVCHVLIDKLAEGTCNAVRCTICNTEFCWLCQKVLTGLGSMTHFTSLSGCTMFGSKRWSSAKRRFWQITTPVTTPLLIAGMGILAPVAFVGLPYMLAVDTWKDAKKTGVSRPKRVFKTALTGTLSAVFVPPLITIGVVGASLRLISYAYVQMPVEQIRDAVRQVREKRRQSAAARHALSSTLTAGAADKADSAGVHHDTREQQTDADVRILWQSNDEPREIDV